MKIIGSSINNRNGAPVESRPQFPPVAMKIGPGAQYIGVSRRMLYALAARGAVAVVRVSPKLLLFKRSDLDRFLESRRVAAVGEEVS